MRGPSEVSGMSDGPAHTERLRSSRQRYRAFVQDYKRRRLDEPDEAGEGQKRADDSTSPVEKAAKAESERKDGRKRREYLRAYSRWLWPHRYKLAALLVFALLAAGFEMVEPLFMRFMVDRVLLNKTLDTVSRMGLLYLTGALFLAT